MHIENPLAANDWPIARFLQLIASLQVAVLIVLGLEGAGLHLPILREALLLVYLLFVPGIILLRVMRMHELNRIEGLFYTVGLSVVTIMLTGLFTNAVYPLFLTARPLTLIPFITTMTAVVVALCALSYVRDRTYASATAFDTRTFAAPLVPALALLPFMSIFGTYAFNVAGTSVGVVITLLAVAAIVAICGLTKAVPRQYYGVVILSVALALLLHNALVTNYLWGFDIQTEQSVSQFVVTNGVWGAPPHIDQDSLNLNSMLSITMLAPLLSIATGASVTWVLKLFFPLLFALVPLALYRLYEKQSTPRIALFGVFYFMVTFSFYTEVLAMARQEIAEFFLVALLLLMIDKQAGTGQRAALLGAFGFALIVSHYSLTYIFLFCLVLTWLIVSLVRRVDLSALGLRGTRQEGTSWVRTLARSQSYRPKAGISGLYVVALVGLAYLWYRFANNPQPLATVTSVIKRTLAFAGIQVPTMLTGDQNASSIGALPSAQGNMSSTGFQTVLVNQFPMHEVAKYLIFIALIVSVIGILVAYRDRRRFRIAPEYFAFALASVVLLGLCAYAPYFAASLNISRFFHITQIALGVFFVIGFLGVLRPVIERVHAPSRDSDVSIAQKALACFMIVLFLFNVGLVYKAAGEVTDSPTVFALDRSVDFSKFNTQEITAARWIGSVNEDNRIYSDVFRFYAIFTIDQENARHLPIGGYWALLPPGSAIYLGTPNVESGMFVMQTNDVTMVPQQLNTTYFVGGSNLVYTNGAAEVYTTNG
ncbi:MAG: DUF2206 domain-containing protein [Halobacteriota archaeon]